MCAINPQLGTEVLCYLQIAHAEEFVSEQHLMRLACVMECRTHSSVIYISTHLCGLLLHWPPTSLDCNLTLIVIRSCYELCTSSVTGNAYLLSLCVLISTFFSLTKLKSFWCFFEIHWVLSSVWCVWVRLDIPNKFCIINWWGSRFNGSWSECQVVVAK